MRATRRFSFFLAPSVIQGAIFFGTLPAATYILDPADYGLYALVTAFTAVGTVIATLGAGAVLAAHFPVLDFEERSRLISTMSLAGALFFVVFAILFALAWEFGVIQWIPALEVPPVAMYAALAAAGLSFPWPGQHQGIAISSRGRVIFASILLIRQRENSYSIG